MAQILVLGAPDEGCAGKHGRSIPLAEIAFRRIQKLGARTSLSEPISLREARHINHDSPGAFPLARAPDCAVAPSIKGQQTE
jgi:hypothetical protein